MQTHRNLAVVTADPALWPQLTARETFDLLGNLHGGCDAAYRDELIERFDLDPDKKVRAFSTGNRQKVALIAAFMTRADVLIFDEPTSGLDPLRKVVFRECLAEAKARGQTIFLSSHLLIEVEASADRVGLLRRGRLVEVGTFEELRHLSAVRVEATFPGTPPDLAGVPGVEGVQVDGEPPELPRARPDRAGARRDRAGAADPPDEPRALARGPLPGALWRRRLRPRARTRSSGGSPSAGCRAAR